MKALIIYDSAYGNTEQIAEAMAGGIGSSHTALLMLVGKVKKSDLKMIDLLVVGSPTQGGRPTQSIQEFIKNLSPKSLSNINFAAFDTRFAIREHGLGLKMLMKTIGFAAPRIAAGLRSKGGTQVAEPEGFIVSDKEGPLAPYELERAQTWMNTLLDVTIQADDMKT